VAKLEKQQTAAAAAAAGAREGGKPRELAAQLRQVLLNAFQVPQYGKQGAPHIRHVCIKCVGQRTLERTLPWIHEKTGASDSFIPLKEVKIDYQGQGIGCFPAQGGQNASDFMCFLW